MFSQRLIDEADGLARLRNMPTEGCVTFALNSASLHRSFTCCCPRRRAHRAGARTPTDDVKPLRLCADPANLPFSSDNPAKPKHLRRNRRRRWREAFGRPVSYDWYKSYFGKRTVRVTLLGKQCDAMIGLPPRAKISWDRRSIFSKADRP